MRPTTARRAHSRRIVAAVRREGLRELAERGAALHREGGGGEDHREQRDRLHGQERKQAGHAEDHADAAGERREAAARVAGELDAARRIQMGLLPHPARLFADENRFSVAALLEPARAVGGDYYDCFMLDEQRLCLAIGDVSGKGIPASLFMAISKTLTGTLARSHADLGLAMRAVELELDRNNSEYLFVTSFISVINVNSGAMEFVCAGHDAPLLRRNGRTLRIDTAPTSGPPLCATGDYPFTTGHTQLQPGDLLCLFTDGVSEAYNGQDMFTGERLAEVFASTINEPTLQRQIEAIRDSVRQFEAGFPPVDDLTLLLARWYGQPRI